MASPWLWRSAVLLALVTATSAFFFRPQLRSTKTDYPLPQSVTPTAYAITLHPHIIEGNYNGSVNINVTCHESTNIITLHAYDELDIIQVQIKNMDTNIEITNISRNATEETISISVEKELESGVSYQLYFEFSGQLQTENTRYIEPYTQERIHGFICKSFTTSTSSHERWFVGISMSPRSLRRVFPCFDEPSFKATFQISITHWRNMSALSVMPIESSELAGDDMVYDHFLTSPPLSTSSVGVLVSDLEKNSTINVTTASGEFSVYFHNKQESYFRDLPDINTTARILEYLQNYLSVPYPLPKLDIVGVPNLYYEMTSSALGLIVMHEFAANEALSEYVNQWFVHVITPRQWELFNISDILSDFMINNAIKKLSIKMTQFQMEKIEFYYIFAGSSYGYGGYRLPSYINLQGIWFLQMLSSSLTEKTMQTALGNLIKNNMYSTFTPDMLWEEITKQSHADGTLPETITVKDLAHSWLRNQSFPVLTVIRNYNDDTAKLQQHMYIHNSSHKMTEAEQEILWPIPITYMTNSPQKAGMLQTVAWLSNKEMVIDNLPPADSFIIVNPTDSGMFLVNYDEQNWALILESLLSSEHNISAETRRKILQDVMLLTSAEELNYATALNMTLFLFNETDYSVWMLFIQTIQSIQKICKDTSAEPKLNTYIRLLLSPIFQAQSQPNYDTQNPESISFWYQGKTLLESVGYQPFIDEMYTNVNRTTPIFTYYDNETGLNILCPQNPTNESEWSTYSLQMQQFINIYLQKASCKCPGFIDYVKSVLNKTVDEEANFASYEFNQIVPLLTTCPESYNITFNFFLEHFDKLRQSYYHVKDVWSTIVSGIVSKIRSEDHLVRMTQFFEENQKKFGYTSSSVKYELQVAKKEIEKNDRITQDIELWLDQVLPRIKEHDM